MQLSKRLQTVADTVTKGNSVADIGCDHAYIAIYLIEEAIAPKVIAMDINKGPLQRADENIRAKGYENRIQTRLSDGLDKLSKDEVETVLMAGIGGALMIRILEEGKEVLEGVNELVLSPQSEINLVRKHLHDNNFAITEEKMIMDEGKYYVVIKAISTSQKEEYKKQVFYQYGKILLESKETVLLEYLKREERLQLEIVDKLKESTGQRSDTRLMEVENTLNIIKEAFSYFE